jgi:hypothetical protein
MDLIFQSVDSIWLATDLSDIYDGFANSKTAFTIIEHVDGNVIHVIYSKQFDNSSTEKMVSVVR